MALDIIQFFTPPATDASIGYLGQIFGQYGPLATIAANGAPVTAPAHTILGEMFRTFNTVALAIGAFIIVYTTVVGVMMTAHEGEFMKKWNSLWTPLRAVFGIATLFPTTSGYSALQFIMLWVIVQGIGAADQVWNTALSYVTVMGSVQMSLSPPQAGITSNMASLFDAVTCDATARGTYALEVETNNDTGEYYCTGSSPPAWCNIPSVVTDTMILPGGSPASFGPPSASCGSLQYCDYSAACATPPISQATCNACQAQMQALKDIVGVFRTAANQLVLTDHLYKDYYYNGFSGAAGSPQQNIATPDVATNYCNANKIQTANGVLTQCRGPLDYQYLTPQQQQALTPQQQSDLASSAGALLDPAADQNSAPSNVVGQIYWTNYLAAIFQSSIDAFNSSQPGAVATGNACSDAPSGKPITGDLISWATKYYNDTIATALGTCPKTAQAPSATPVQSAPGTLPTSGALFNAMSSGWIFAGAYYYYLVQSNGQTVATNLPTFQVIAIDPAAAGDQSGTSPTMNNLRNNFEAAAALVKAMAGQNGSNVGGANTQVLSDGVSAISTMMNSATADLNINPLVQVATSGYWLLVAAQQMFAVFMVMSIVLGLLSGINAFVIGTGLINPMFVSSPMMMMIMVPMVGSLLALMVSMGALLGVYVPLIPFMIFTFGAIGWMMACVEALVAGPLVSLGILAPGGHHEILGKAEPALMMLFQVFLRPTLMVFGLIASMLLATVAVKMINSVFWLLVVPSIGNTGISGGTQANNNNVSNVAMVMNPLMMVFFLVAYVSMIVSAISKCCAAIHIVPERVVSWIGGQGMQFGEGEALGEAKRGIEGGAASAGQGAKATGQSVEKGSETEATRDQVSKHGKDGTGGFGGQREKPTAASVKSNEPPK